MNTQTVGVCRGALDPDRIQRVASHIGRWSVSHHRVAGGPSIAPRGGRGCGKCGLNATDVHGLTKGHRKGGGYGHACGIMSGR